MIMNKFAKTPNTILYKVTIEYEYYKHICKNYRVDYKSINIANI